MSDSIKDFYAQMLAVEKSSKTPAVSFQSDTEETAKQESIWLGELPDPEELGDNFVRASDVENALDIFEEPVKLVEIPPVIPNEPTVSFEPSVEVTPQESVVEPEPFVEITPKEIVFDFEPSLEVTPEETVVSFEPSVEVTPQESVVEPELFVETTPQEITTNIEPSPEVTQEETIVSFEPSIEVTPQEIVSIPTIISEETDLTVEEAIDTINEISSKYSFTLEDAVSSASLPNFEEISGSPYEVLNNTIMDISKRPETVQKWETSGDPAYCGKYVKYCVTEALTELGFSQEQLDEIEFHSGPSNMINWAKTTENVEYTDLTKMSKSEKAALQEKLPPGTIFISRPMTMRGEPGWHTGFIDKNGMTQEGNTFVRGRGAHVVGQCALDLTDSKYIGIINLDKWIAGLSPDFT